MVFTKKTLSVVSLLIICLFGLTLGQSTHIPISSEHKITRHMDGFMQKLHFSFTVGTVYPDQDLLFIVNPLDWISNPDILISSVKPVPRLAP